MHMVQLMPLPLTVSCFSKMQVGFTFLVPAHTGSPRQRTVKRVFVYVCVIYPYCHRLVCMFSSSFFSFYHAMLCIRGTSHGPVSVCVCHKSEFY